MALILRGISLIKNPKIGVFELFSSEINCNFLGSQKSTFENDPVLTWFWFWTRLIVYTEMCTISWAQILHDFKMPVKTDLPIFYTVVCCEIPRISKCLDLFRFVYTIFA